MDPIELPVLGGTAVERTDAQRNRRRILEAAERLIAGYGMSCVSLDRIAAEAGVGKGTVFRRFGDRSGLLRALLSEREAALQERLIRGEPPAGPGAAPRDRLLAFGPAYLEFVAQNVEILAVAELRGSFAAAPYAFLHIHVHHLLEEASPDGDADYLVDALLAPLRADLVLHQLEVRGFTVARLAAGWQALAAGLLPPPAIPSPWPHAGAGP